MLDAILLGIALAMDSSAVSIVNGIKYRNYSRYQMLAASFSFGFFQGLMPLLGYLIFTPFVEKIQRYDHWAVLIILTLLGINMIRESFEKEEIKEKSEEFTFRIMIMESIATSIDALSSGIVLSSFSISPYLTCFIIFIVTFILCIIAHRLGKHIGLLLKDKATILGGVILILIGVKTVLEHLNIL